MIDLFETPISFVKEKKNEYYIVKYDNIVELCQGGPEVGNIKVNNQMLSGRFGGPFLLENNKVYASFFEKNWLNSGFRIAIIDLETREHKLIGKKHNIVFITKTINNFICFYTDIEKRHEFFIEL